MDSIQRIVCLATLAAFIALALPAQGPLDGYLKGAGVLDLAPSISFNSAKDYLGADKQVYALGYEGTLISLFAEYGLNRYVDVVGTAAYVFTATQSGLQDGGLFVKYRPIYRDLGGTGRIGAMLGTGLSFPLSDYEPTLSGALGQQAVQLPLRLIVQWETPLGLFFNLTGGYNWRLDRLPEKDIAAIRVQRPDYQPVSPPNFTTFLFRVGFPAARYYADSWVEWQRTDGGADFVPGRADLPQSFGVSYVQIGGTAYYSESGRGGFFVSGGYILNGRNTSRTLRLTAGMVLSFGKAGTEY